VMQSAAVCCYVLNGVLQYVAAVAFCTCCNKFSVLQCVAVCCSVLQCDAVRCSVMPCVACVTVSCSALQCAAVCCSVLQCAVAVRCNVVRALRSVAV